MKWEIEARSSFKFGQTARKYITAGLLPDLIPSKVHADISGANVLKLVVTDGGDGTGYDHADWANAHIARSNVNR